jgi:hypothetical protein
MNFLTPSAEFFWASVGQQYFRFFGSDSWDASDVSVPVENISRNPPFGAFMFSSWAFDLEMRSLVWDFFSFLIVWILAFSVKLSHIASWRSQIHSEYRKICSRVRWMYVISAQHLNGQGDCPIFWALRPTRKIWSDFSEFRRNAVWTFSPQWISTFGADADFGSHGPRNSVVKAISSLLAEQKTSCGRDKSKYLHCHGKTFSQRVGYDPWVFNFQQNDQISGRRLESR